MASSAASASCSVRSMRAALARARMAPTEIDYVSAHATSTPGGDGEEAAAIATVFAENKANLKKLVDFFKKHKAHMIVIAGDTGIPLSTRLQSFVMTKGHANELAPGKRPRTTLSPAMALKEGRQAYLLRRISSEASIGKILFENGLKSTNAPHVVRSRSPS